MSEKNTPQKRFYWLKLFKDFFEDATIKYIESQENGILYSYFYLKLCCKSLDMESDGMLVRYIGNKVIPHDAVSLADLTRTDVDIVRSALKLFLEWGLVEKRNEFLYLP